MAEQKPTFLDANYILGLFIYLFTTNHPRVGEKFSTYNQKEHQSLILTDQFRFTSVTFMCQKNEETHAPRPVNLVFFPDVVVWSLKDLLLMNETQVRIKF